ncbi:MAG TPA: LysR family transcriptional regulator [Stellaceae bacterium]|nr:LysR family transcriptional regulator [Stellaceae bacterium]
MELRHLRYFVAVGEDQHYGRASRRLGVAQPALSRQIQDLEKEIGFKLFDRMPRGVKLSAAGELFLKDARRILQDVGDATTRAARLARGQSGTLRVGFAENVSWHGVVPESFRRFREQQPGVDLQLQPAASLEQLEAIRSGRLDAGFVNFMPKVDADLDQLAVGRQQVELALPKGHPLTRLKKLRLRDLTDAPFIWFPRQAGPAFYDRLMNECYRGGLKSPRIIQEGLNEATILSLVSTGLGVGWVLGSARWRCPQTIAVLPVVDLNMPVSLALAWRRDNTSPLLARFIDEVRRMREVRAVNKG